MPFYVFINEGGRIWQGGPCATSNDAVAIGITRGHEYEIKEYNTRDPRKAKGLYNMEIFKLGRPIEDIQKRHFKIKR